MNILSINELSKNTIRYQASPECSVFYQLNFITTDSVAAAISTNQSVMIYCATQRLHSLRTLQITKLPPAFHDRLLSCFEFLIGLTLSLALLFIHFPFLVCIPGDCATCRSLRSSLVPYTPYGSPEVTVSPACPCKIITNLLVRLFALVQ